MSRSVVETVLGALVLIGALVFFVFSYSEGDAGTVSGYKISANFSGIGGLQVGDDVLVSGVKVGQVSAIELDSKQYLARVTAEIDNDIELPDDTVALISSQSLLGGKYMALEPGGSPDMIEDGGEILFTQAPQNLEELLGKFIFSMQKNDNAAPTAAASPAVSSPTVTHAAPALAPMAGTKTNLPPATDSVIPDIIPETAPAPEDDYNQDNETE